MRTLKNKILALAMLVFVNVVQAQYIEIGASLGVASYQGDINPLAWRLSFQGARFQKGISLGYHFNPYFGVKLKFMDTFLEANDNLSLSHGRKIRNLHFKSDLKEYSICFETEALNLLPWFKSQKLKPYLLFGVGVFQFNPKAKLNGIWHELQPLGTEGQGLPGSENGLYSLTQFTIPLGVGFRYHVDKNVIISIEVTPRITFTDYIDDVSTTYPDLALLRENRGQIAYDIAFKGDEMAGFEGNPLDWSGSPRGNPNENDWYATSTITFTYRLDPEFTISKKRKFAGYYHCPFEK